MSLEKYERLEKIGEGNYHSPVTLSLLGRYRIPKKVLMKV